MFRYDLVPFGLGILRDVFQTFVMLLGHPARFFLAPNTEFPKLEDMAIFQKHGFRQTLYLCVTYFERYPIIVVRMDHGDHLGFGNT